MANSTVYHEKSYGKRYLGGLIHRARLHAIVGVLKQHLGAHVQSWADFGCSNGYIIESVLVEGGVHFQSIIGYDHSHELLENGRRKDLPNTRFEYFDLNGSLSLPQQFELVTCFETLEHVADYRHGFEHLYHYLMDGGLLVVVVPNETGLPGCIKLLGRYLARRNPYGNFFEETSRFSYALSVARKKRLGGFRRPKPGGYGPHLGFDYRQLEDFIDCEYVKPKRLFSVERQMTFLGMNVIMVYRKQNSNMCV